MSVLELGKDTQNSDDSAQVEVGAIGEELRLWQAREALRQAELRLASQATTLQALETRSAAIFGWVVVAVSAISGAMIIGIDSGRLARILALSIALIPAFASALFASRLFRPKKWGVSGYEPHIVLDQCDSELQQTEYLVSGYAESINDNLSFLDKSGGDIKRAWWALIFTPITALIGIFLATAGAAEAAIAIRAFLGEAVEGVSGVVMLGG